MIQPWKFDLYDNCYTSHSSLFYGVIPLFSYCRHFFLFYQNIPVYNTHTKYSHLLEKEVHVVHEKTW